MRLKKKVLSNLLVVTMLSQCFGITSYAANIQEIPATEIESVYEGEVDSNKWEGWVEGPKIYSESGIVMDMDSGTILYAKNIDDQHYPASITKVMTALVALENYEMDEAVKFTWEDVGCVPTGYAHIGIKPDEELSMEDCMYGMLLASANEVSHAIGAHIEGGHEEFLRVMNDTAKNLGCTNSNWTNTNGIHDPEHYTSARDMALIGSAVFKHEKFREIVNTPTYVIGETNITNETRPFRQNHKMIFENGEYYYEYCVGGKTGYTDASLTTLVTFATKDDMNLVAVVMRTHGGGANAYADTRAMMDYAFENFSKLTVDKEVLGDVSVASVKEGSYVILPKNVDVQQLSNAMEKPTEENDKTGTVSYTYAGNKVGEVEFEITDEEYDKIHNVKEKEEIAKKQELKSNISQISKIVLIVVTILVILYFVLLGYVTYRRRQIKKKRQAMRRKQQRNKKH